MSAKAFYIKIYLFAGEADDKLIWYRIRITKMTRSEEFVYRLCTKSFLSLWSYPNPLGKNRKELCDVLVVCDPDIIIFSVKEIEYKDTGDDLGRKRWHKKAIDESFKQIYGAERWINLHSNVITNKGEIDLPFPDISKRRIHRIAVAIGSKGIVPMFFGDFGKGFVHVFDEISFEEVLKELDTITDFVQYLIDKEAFFATADEVAFTGEEQLLAYYLLQGRKFPSKTSLVITDNKLWQDFKSHHQVKEREELNNISYVWDRLIQLIYNDYVEGGITSALPDSTVTLSNVELLIRTMARENRFSRRILGKSYMEFLTASKRRETKSRIVVSPSNVGYLFLACDLEDGRNFNMAELGGRCLIARGFNKDIQKVVGIGVETSPKQKGFSLITMFLEISIWNEELQKQMEFAQKEFGFFANPVIKRRREDEYPPLKSK